MCYKYILFANLRLSRCTFKEYGAKLKLMFFNSKKKIMKLLCCPEFRVIPRKFLWKRMQSYSYNLLSQAFCVIFLFVIGRRWRRMARLNVGIEGFGEEGRLFCSWRGRFLLGDALQFLRLAGRWFAFLLDGMRISCVFARMAARAERGS